MITLFVGNMVFLCEPCEKEISFAHAWVEHLKHVLKDPYSDALLPAQEAVGNFARQYIGTFDLDIEYAGGSGKNRRYYVTYLTAAKEANPRIRRTKLKAC